MIPKSRKIYIVPQRPDPYPYYIEEPYFGPIQPVRIGKRKSDLYNL